MYALITTLSIVAKTLDGLEFAYKIRAGSCLEPALLVSPGPPAWAAYLACFPLLGSAACAA